MRSHAAVWFVAMAGCSFTASDSTPDLSPDAPGSVGNPPQNNPPGCHGTRPFTKVCLATEPTAAIVNLGGTIDTDSYACAETKPGSVAGSCVIAGTSISVKNLIAVGSKPLILLATEVRIQMSGDLDVASHIGPPGTRGAGAGGTCNAGMPPISSGGGQGGSFGSRGGNAGNSGTVAGAGIAGNPVSLETTLRGGCPGGPGNGLSAGAGGLGGGVIVMIAPRIEMSGNLNASGAAGARGGAGGGGAGGGGSGGTIIFDTPDLQLSGRAFANGGGGGGAGDLNSAGTAGSDPTVPTAGATGGTGVQGGGTGGAGSTGGVGGVGGGGSGDGGGGGGGGGAGLILTTAPTLPAPSANVSPAVTRAP